MRSNRAWVTQLLISSGLGLVLGRLFRSWFPCFVQGHGAQRVRFWARARAVRGLGRRAHWARCNLRYNGCSSLPPGAFLLLCSASLPRFVVPVSYAPRSCTLGVGWPPNLFLLCQPVSGGPGGVGGGRLAVLPIPPTCTRSHERAQCGHDAGTLRGTEPCVGAMGGSNFLPTYGGRHVSSMSSVPHACSLVCPYLLAEVRTRLETEDEEVRAAGRTYPTPRGLFVPSAALVEGRARASAPNGPGGGGG